jgi:hypothetical protein
MSDICEKGWELSYNIRLAIRAWSETNTLAYEIDVGKYIVINTSWTPKQLL